MQKKIVIKFNLQKKDIEEEKFGRLTDTKPRKPQIDWENGEVDHITNIGGAHFRKLYNSMCAKRNKIIIYEADDYIGKFAEHERLTNSEALNCIFMQCK